MRLFVYQRNVERMAGSLERIDGECRRRTRTRGIRGISRWSADGQVVTSTEAEWELADVIGRVLRQGRDCPRRRGDWILRDGQEASLFCGDAMGARLIGPSGCSRRRPVFAARIGASCRCVRRRASRS